MKKLILASNSPRRKELFSLFGWPFEVVPADIDEARQLGEPPIDYVRRLACEKAEAVAERKKGLVIAADTIVADGDELLGKPADEDEARQMLKQLRARTHQVYTGVAIIDTDTGQSFVEVVQTDVLMRDYTDAEIEAYIASGDPMDKAGAYAIQHRGFSPVRSLDGCYASVMGLPICRLTVGLRQFGLEPPEDLFDRCQTFFGYECPVLGKVLDEV